MGENFQFNQMIMGQEGHPNIEYSSLEMDDLKG
jgi:hypothetical protein